MPDNRHRHWVIGPLFLLLAALSSSTSLSLSETSPAASSREGGEETLLHDEGMIIVHRGDLSFSGMHGAFTLSEQAGHISVASLTTPVLVRGESTLVLVPIGFQWRSGGEEVLLQIPHAFQYAKLQELEDAFSSSRSLQLDPSAILPAALRLPAAQERHEDAVRMQQLATLAHAVARGRSLDRMIQSDALVEALSSEEGYHLLPKLLAELADDPHDRMLLFPFLFQEEEGALLALFHPTFRDHAALLAINEMSPNARALYRRLLPRSDLLSHALSPLAFSRWEEGVTKEFSEYRDPLPLFTTLLTTIEDVVRESVRHGYVERAQRYITAAEHFSSSLDLTPELRARLDALPSLSVEDPELAEREPLPISASSASSVVSSVPPSDPVAPAVEPAVREDLTKRAVADLTTQGGMFIPNTTIEALSTTAVQVSSLVLATAKGDALFDFTYDVATQEVADITRGSTQYPYTVPLQQFIQWVRGG